MAIKGLSIPVFGKYTLGENGAVTYTGGMINPHAISYTLSPESSDSNPLYGDNRIIENDKQMFNGAVLTLETDDLDDAISMFILGLKEVERSYGESKTVTAIVYDDEQNAPVLGFGIIEEHQNNDKDQYKAVWLKKVIFNIPEDAATTRAGAVEWQTKTIEANVMRSDETGENGVHPWKESAWFDKESEAIAYLKSVLGVTETA